MRAPPTDHPSPGYDLILFDQQREELSAAHVLEYQQRQLRYFLTCAKAFFSTQGKFTSIHQIAKEFPASWSLVQLHL